MTSIVRTAFLLGVWVLGGGIGSLVFAEAPREDSAEAKVRRLIDGLKLHELREDAAASGLDVYGSYEEARQLEAEVVQMYKEIRAAELSLIQRQTLDQSLESTLSPLSERAKVDEKLLTAPAQDAETVKEYQAELGVVMRETDAMVANAKELLDSFVVEQKKDETMEQKAEEMTPEEIAAMATQPPAPPPAAESPLDQKQKQELAQQQQALQTQIDKDLAEVEVNLAEALEEIKATKELVREEMKVTELEAGKLEKEIAQQEAADPRKDEELKEKKEKEKALEQLDRKVDAADQIVQEVVTQLQTVTEVPEEQIEKAEKVVAELRQALAAVMETDAAVSPEEQKPAKEHSEQAVAEVQAAQQAMEAAAEGMAEMEKMATALAALGAGEKLSGNAAIAQMQALGALSNAVSGKWLDVTAQMRGMNLDAKPVEVPVGQRPALWESIEPLKNAPSARKFMSRSDRGGDWIFLGDWYVLSRYDNARRTNLQKVYPPESILDLDARYASEDGQSMHWEYESYLPPTVIPYGWESWKIYYFFTELYFEEATEAWLAIGSDDRSDVWINDLPIWHSSNEHKGWLPSEGFRKVYFKQGRNKILVRLENGHQGLGFSLFLKLDR